MTERSEIPPMDAAEFRDVMDQIGWRVSDLAWVLAIDGRVTSRWASGVKEVPVYVGAWLRVLAAFHNEHRYPENWRVLDDGDEVVTVENIRAL